MDKQQRFQQFLLVAALLLGMGTCPVLLAQSTDRGQPPALRRLPDATGGSQIPLPGPPPETILQPGEFPIDLGSALRMGGAENPELLLARERIVEATAVRQLAAAQLLPNLNVGANFNLHRGALQQANGNILNVNRDSLYVGMGANAVGAGTVNIPGLNYNLNIGEGWYGYLISRQRVVTAEAVAIASRNEILLRVSLAYLALLQAEAHQAISGKNREEAAEVARLTAEFARSGQGRRADADRAAVELKRRDAEMSQAEGEILEASAQLARVLNLDPATLLKPVEGWAVPTAIVPDPIPLYELLAMALLQRPELAARRSDIQAALYALALAKVLPLSPNVVLGFSAGGFGGGSNLVAAPGGFIAGDGTRIVDPRFSNLEDRADFDVVVFWTFRNMGVGNLALIRAADSRAKQARLRELETLNLVRSQVAEAHGWSAARLQQIDASENAVRASQDAFTQDFTRIKGGQGLPLELIDSLRLLGRSRYEYVDSIIDYNRAQLQLWVALGQPPADRLARPVPAELLPQGASTSPPKILKSSWIPAVLLPTSCLPIP
jgi:outer membrane protein TolC